MTTSTMALLDLLPKAEAGGRIRSFLGMGSYG
jgi:hypothetical protein